jgi:hypothetical protein
MLFFIGGQCVGHAESRWYLQEIYNLELYNTLNDDDCVFKGFSHDSINRSYNKKETHTQNDSQNETRPNHTVLVFVSDARWFSKPIQQKRFP